MERMNICIPDAYEAAVTESGIEPIDQPSITDVDVKDGVFTFVAVAPVKPEVTLKDYKGLTAERPEDAVADEEVETELTRMGLTVLLGQLIGAGDRERAGDAVGAGIAVFGILGAALTAAMALLARPLCRLLDAPPEALADTVRYVRICSLGLLLIIAYNVFGGIFRGLGDARTPLYAVMIACAVNIGGDLLLVAVFHMQTLLEHIEGGVLLCEMAEEPRILYASPSFFHFSGRSRESLGPLGERIFSVVWPDDLPQLMEKLRAGAAQGRVVDCAYRVTEADGRTGWRHLRAVRIPYEQAAHPVLLGVVTDITELIHVFRNLLLTLMLLSGLYGIAVFSDIPFVEKWRAIYIETAMGTMNHQWLATYFIPESVITRVMNQRYGVEADQNNLSTGDWSISESGKSPTRFWSKLKGDFDELYPEIDRSTLNKYLKKKGDCLDDDGYLVIDQASLDDKDTGIRTTEGDRVLALDTRNGIVILRHDGDEFVSRM